MVLPLGGFAVHLVPSSYSACNLDDCSESPLNTPLRILITIACLLAAIACYAIGVPAGGVAFIVLGIIFEGLFWLRVFGKDQRSRRDKSR